MLKVRQHPGWHMHVCVREGKARLGPATVFFFMTSF